MTREEAIKLLVIYVKLAAEASAHAVDPMQVLDKGFKALVSLGVWEWQISEAIEQVLEEAAS